ncbi:MAG TPA: TonB-dependent receptor, partial [Acidobacteriota bacterium]|nr:TonB-dependent receptor [Acidobacteriota bacterium]
MGVFDRKTILVCLALAILAGVPLWGQADRATISGTVTDPTGGVLPGVEVVATNLATGVQTRTITNEVGNYSLVNIPIGTYAISFSLPGFKTYERTDFTVTTAQRARLDVTLEVGELTETVTVSANSQLIDTDSPLIATMMLSEVITDLPLSFEGGRSVENFAYAITPGVEGNNWTSFLVGGQAFSKEVLIDGVSATAHIQGHVGESSPPMEAVQEFKVQTSGMSAEYGRTSGGVFQFALKSGTNKFSGSAFYYGRNEALNANTWMNNWNLAQDPDNPRYERARDRQSLFGGSAGGPVVIPGIYNGRDRTFIFGAFEQYERESYQLGPMNQTVPIPPFLDGDFSALLTNEKVGTDALGRDVFAGQIYDPATLHQVGGAWVADPFAGNVIPSDRISPISARIADIFRQHYKPMVPGRLTNNSALTETNNPWFHQTQLTVKVDHAFTDNHKLSGSFIWTQRPRVLADQGGIWDPEDPNGWGGPLSKARKQEVKSRRVVVSDNWTLRPTLINTLSLAFNRYINPSVATPDLAGGDWVRELGLGQAKYGNFPEISFGSAVNGVDITDIGYNANGRYVANTYILSDSVDWIKGRHNLKFGGEVWWQQHNAPDDNDMLSFSFANWTTGQPKASYQNRVGFGFASFLLGEVDSASKNVPLSLYGRRGYVAMYLNDDFKVTSRLTLNLGIRWEQARPLTEVNGNWANFTPKVLNTNPNGYWPIDPGVPGALEFATGPDTTFEGDQEWLQFSPRLGFAYRITDKVVLRGGYGIFYSPLGTQYWGGIPYGRFAAPDIAGIDVIPTKGQTVPNFNWDAGGYPGNFQPGNRDPNFLTWGMV